MQQQDEARRRVERMASLAAEMSQLIDVGMTIEVKIPDGGDIIVPGRKRGVTTIVVSKPSVKVTLEPR